MKRLSVASEVSIEIRNERPTKLQTVKLFIRNKEEHTYCGLTLRLWVHVFLFYNAFFTILIGLTLAVWYSSSNTVSSAERPWIFPEKPTYFKSPRLTLKGCAESMTIWYRASYRKDEHDRKTYPQEISKFLSEYQLPDSAKSDYLTCGNNFHRKPGNKPCIFDLERLGPCKDADYGYSTGQPCIYLNLNKMQFWKPECYRYLDELPAEMPNSLKQLIETHKELEMVWVSCEGDTPADEEYMGDLKMYPFNGFDAKFFPYFGDKNFLSPILALKLDTATPGHLITIKCTTWAKNIVEHNTLYIQIIIDMTT